MIKIGEIVEGDSEQIEIKGKNSLLIEELAMIIETLNKHCGIKKEFIEAVTKIALESKEDKEVEKDENKSKEI